MSRDSRGVLWARRRAEKASVTRQEVAMRIASLADMEVLVRSGRERIEFSTQSKDGERINAEDAESAEKERKRGKKEYGKKEWRLKSCRDAAQHVASLREHGRPQGKGSKTTVGW